MTAQRAKIERQAEVGYTIVETQTPALVSVMKSINEPRYPSMKGIMQSKKKPIDTMSLADLGVDAGTVGAGASGEKALSAEKIATQRKGEIYHGQRWRRRARCGLPRRAEGVVAMANDVWALAEITNGKLASISLQLASKAAELAGTLGGSSAAVALGTNTQAAASDLGACGVQTVYASEGAVYDEYLDAAARGDAGQR